MNGELRSITIRTLKPRPKVTVRSGLLLGDLSTSNETTRFGEGPDVPVGYKRILIYPMGTFREIKFLSNYLRTINKNCQLILLIQKERLPFLKDLNLWDEIIVFDNYRMSTKSTIALLYKLFKGRFEAGISSNNSMPFIFPYALRKNFTFDVQKKSFQNYDENINKIWKLFISFILGEISAVFIFPAILRASFRVKRNKK